MEKEKFVKLERRLIEHRSYRLAGPFARDLYTCMLNSIYNPNNGGINRTTRKAKFGPMDAALFEIPKTTYYRAIDQLIQCRIIEELSPGGHGRKSEYDLEAWKYKFDF